jgi:hypothetical protein
MRNFAQLLPWQQTTISQHLGHRRPIQMELATLLITLVTLVVTASGCTLAGPPPSPKQAMVTAPINAAQGGTLTLPNLATLTIPPHALSADAQVTLRAVGKPAHANSDPLTAVSEAVSASATTTSNGSSGTSTSSTSSTLVTLLAPATLALTPEPTASQGAQDLIIGEYDPSIPGVDYLHYALGAADGTGATLKTLSYRSSALGHSFWIVKVPTLSPHLAALSAAARPRADGKASGQGQQLAALDTAATSSAAKRESIKAGGATSAHADSHTEPLAPTEGDILEVPWYSQGALPWCSPTTLAATLRYADFTPLTGDSYTAQFGSTTALANWQIAAQNRESATEGAYYNPQLVNVGIGHYDNLLGSEIPVASSAVQQYTWDADMIASYILDFRAYAISVTEGDRRPIAMAVDAKTHSVAVVGATMDGLYIHDSSGAITGQEAIAQYFTWDAFKALAKRSIGETFFGADVEIRRIDTAVVYLPIKPEAQRRGSIVMVPGDMSFYSDPAADLSSGPQTTLAWDGARPHTHGYYFTDKNGGGADSDLGLAALRHRPLSYQFRVANVTNVPLSFTAVAQVFSDDHGPTPASQEQTVTVPPYSKSNYLTGTFQQPASGSQAIFAVELYNGDSVRTMPDAKFVRYSLKEGPPPTVKITTPPDQSTIIAGTDVVFTATSSDGALPLPDSGLAWTANGTPIGTGARLVHSFSTPGQYTITLTGTGPDGLQSSTSITLTVLPPLDRSTPHVQITAPASGTHVYAGDNVVFTATSSDGALPLPDSGLAWTANGAPIGTGATLVHRFSTPSQYIITLTGTLGNGQRATASVTLIVDPKPVTSPPSVKITSPADGTVIDTGASSDGLSAQVKLVGIGSAGMQFLWSDSIQGYLGSGDQLTVTLYGQARACRYYHTITLKGVDPQGRTAQASITVDVHHVSACVG